MTDKSTSDAALARKRADALPLTELNPAQPSPFEQDVIGPYFERLRREDPVHDTAESAYGAYWSITKFADIVAVETNHEVFSSQLGGMQIGGNPETALPMFIAMDPPKHDLQRKTVSPAVSPGNLDLLEALIRQRAGLILDALPIGEEFDRVDRVPWNSPP